MEVNEADAKYLVPARRRPTELGALPADWAVIELATRSTIQSGIAKNANAVLRDPVAVPYLRVANVQDGYLDLREVAWIEIERADLNRYAVLPGDVLMNEGGDLDKLGRGALWHGQIGPCVHQNHVFVVRCKTGLVPEYLNAWTSTAQARRYFMLAGRQTTNLASINKSSLGQLTVAVPPTEGEQREIANAICDAEALIDSLEQLLTKKRQIKQGAMQELLTGKRRLPGFTGDWADCTLQRLADIRSGGTPSTRQAEFWDGAIPWCTPTDITALAGAKHISETERSISDKGQKASSAEMLPAGTIVMTSRATIGECAIASVPLTTNQGFKNFIPRDTTCGEFLYYLLGNLQSAFLTLCSGSTFLEIGKRQLEDFIVRCPIEYDEQHAIAEVLSSIDTEITALEFRLTKARALKQAMAQALLTGRIRLVEPSA